MLAETNVQKRNQIEFWSAFEGTNCPRITRDNLISLYNIEVEDGGYTGVVTSKNFFGEL